MKIKRHFTRLGAVLAGVSALTLLGATSASANWNSWIGSWTDGETSDRWDEQGTYSQLQFRSCYAQYAGSSHQTVDILMWVDKSWASDKKLDRKIFSECFKGATHWSNGEWTDVPSGSVKLYFEADKVGSGDACCLLDVAEVRQDTSMAD